MLTGEKSWEEKSINKKFFNQILSYFIFLFEASKAEVGIGGEGVEDVEDNPYNNPHLHPPPPSFFSMRLVIFYSVNLITMKNPQDFTDFSRSQHEFTAKRLRKIEGKSLANPKINKTFLLVSFHSQYSWNLLMVTPVCFQALYFPYTIQYNTKGTRHKENHEFFHTFFTENCL